MNKVVLVVDDEELILELVRRILMEAGHLALTARSAEEAAEHLKNGGIDLIICDLNMPRINGIKFVTAIRHRRIPVIIFSAHATPQNVVESVRAGAIDFMSKSGFKPDTLMKKVAKHLKMPGSSATQPHTAVASGNVQADTARPSAPRTAAQAATSHTLDVNAVSFEKKLAAIQEIKALPFVAAEMLKLTSNTETSPKQLVEVIIRDQAISSKVLQVSNSTAFKTKKRVLNLEQAIMNIGFSGIRDIALGVSMVEEFMGEKGGLNRLDAWKRGLATAVLARRLAEAGKYAEPDMAFLAGLLHDIGQIILDEHFMDDYKAVLSHCKTTNMPLEEAERVILGIDHCGMAQKVMAHWNLPEKIRDVTVFHHHSVEKLQNLQSKDQQLIALVSVASDLADGLHLGSLDADLSRLRRIDDRMLVLAGLSEKGLCAKSTEGLLADVRDLESILLLHSNPGQAAKPLPLKTGKRLGLFGVHDDWDPLALRYMETFTTRAWVPPDAKELDALVIGVASDSSLDVAQRVFEAPPCPTVALVADVYAPRLKAAHASARILSDTAPLGMLDEALAELQVLA
ncbi:MAG: HDOD domain-containing protein [Planctomycetota bacterium]